MTVVDRPGCAGPDATSPFLVAALLPRSLGSVPYTPGSGRVAGTRRPFRALQVRRVRGVGSGSGVRAVSGVGPGLDTSATSGTRHVGDYQGGVNGVAEGPEMPRTRVSEEFSVRVWAPTQTSVVTPSVGRWRPRSLEGPRLIDSSRCEPPGWTEPPVRLVREEEEGL